MPKYSKFMRDDVAENLVKAGCKATDNSTFGHLLRYGHDHYFEPGKQPNSTGANPGSEEKIRIIAERMRRGEELFHDGDNYTAATIQEQDRTASVMIEKAKELRDQKREAREAKEAIEASKAKRAKQSA